MSLPRKPPPRTRAAGALAERGRVRAIKAVDAAIDAIDEALERLKRESLEAERPQDAR